MANHYSTEMVSHPREQLVSALPPRWLVWIQLNLMTRNFTDLSQSSFPSHVVAWLEVCLLGMQAALSSIPMAGTFFRGDLVILPLPLIQEEQLSVTGERMCTKYW